MAVQTVILPPEGVERLPWRPVPGTPGLFEKILFVHPESGSYTRLLRAEPGVVMADRLVHEFWEETYILDGGWYEQGVFFAAGTYTCLPPGTEHGPYTTPTGFLCLEHRYHLGRGR
jgi:hypothetical protein